MEDKIERIERYLRKIYKMENKRYSIDSEIPSDMIPENYIIKAVLESKDENDIIFWLWKSIYMKLNNHRYNKKSRRIEIYYQGEWKNLDSNPIYIKIILEKLLSFLYNVIPDDFVNYYENEATIWLRILHKINFSNTPEYIETLKNKIYYHLANINVG